MSSLFAGLAVLGCLYWAATALLALVRPRQRRPAAVPDEAVAVVIPAFNEATVLGRCLAAIAASRRAPAEVIVVDDGSADATAAVAAATLAGRPGASVIRLPANCGKAAALNAGLAAVRSPLVLTLDADTAIAPDCLDWALAAIPGRAGVACNVRAVSHTWLAGVQAAEYVGTLNLERRALAVCGAITTLPGAATLWRRSALLALGGFSGRTLAEDTDLTLQAQRRGMRLGFADRAIADTLVPQGLPALLRQRDRWFWGNAACAVIHAGARRAPARFRAIAAVFALLNLAAVPFLLLTYLLAAGLLLQGQASLVCGFGLLLGLLGLLRAAVGFHKDGQPLPPPWVLLAALFLMPMVTVAAALRATRRQVRGEPVTWGRVSPG